MFIGSLQGFVNYFVLSSWMLTSIIITTKLLILNVTMIAISKKKKKKNKVTMIAKSPPLGRTAEFVDFFSL